MVCVNSANPLVAKAREAAAHAHCPYSNFHVGAAVQCADGSIITGCNVENASYGLSICAERVALFNAISQGKRPISLAVSCVDAQGETSLASRMPCGACRQVMQEFLPGDASIHIDGVGTQSLIELLPNAFDLNQLAE